MPGKASVNVGQNVVDGHSMAVNSERDPHALGDLDQISVMEHQTSVGDAQIRHQQHRCDVGVVVAKCTDGDVELVDRNLFENRPVKVVAVNDVDVEMSTGFRASQLVGEMEFTFQDRHTRPVFQPIFGHLCSNGRGTDDDDVGVLGEVGDLMPKRDEGRIELVEANHRNSNTIANLEDAVVVRNETPLPVTLHAHNVWQAMHEVFSHFSERASHEVDGGLADVKFDDVGFFAKRDDLLKFG